MCDTKKLKAKSQPQLKVCGLTKLDQIQELISMNVDFLGFIFYEKSPRFVLNHLSVEEISKINHSAKVGVFVNESLNKIIEVAEKADLNFVQLHGDENEEFVSELRKKLNPEIEIIQVIRIANQSYDELEKTINRQLSTINYLLFDTDSKTFGGTGKTFDWNVLNKVEIPLPYFLSGGISLENIENIELLNQKPFALDINSKFEIEPGNKDVEKIRKFISLDKAFKKLEKKNQSMRNHNYKSKIEWTGNTGESTKNYRSYERNYTISVDGKAEINGSSDPAFLGNPELHNPEDLLLASVSSCHLLWYLHFCSVNKILVLEYIDFAEGIMIEEENGSGKFTEIVLKPKIVVAEKEMIEKAIELHQKANEYCFIANSLNFKVKHQPEITYKND